MYFPLSTDEYNSKNGENTPLITPNYYLPLQRLSYQEKEDGNVQQKKNYHSIGYRYLAYQPYLSLCIPQCHFMPYR